MPLISGFSPPGNVLLVSVARTRNSLRFWGETCRQADSVHIPASAGITITLSGISRGSYTYKLYHVAGDQNYSTAYCAPTDMGRDNPMNGIIAGGQMSIPLTIISPSQETRPENMAVRYLIRARP